MKRGNIRECTAATVGCAPAPRRCRQGTNQNEAGEAKSSRHPSTRPNVAEVRRRTLGLSCPSIHSFVSSQRRVSAFRALRYQAHQIAPEFEHIHASQSVQTRRVEMACRRARGPRGGQTNTKVSWTIAAPWRVLLGGDCRKGSKSTITEAHFLRARLQTGIAPQEPQMGGQNSRSVRWLRPCRREGCNDSRSTARLCRRRRRVCCASRCPTCCGNWVSPWRAMVQPAST